MKQIGIVLCLLLFTAVSAGCTTKTSTTTCESHTTIIDGLQNRVDSLERDSASWKARAQKSELDLMAANERLAVMAANKSDARAQSDMLDMLDTIDRRISKLPTATGDVSVTALPGNAGYKITIIGDVLFDSGKADVREEGKRVLDSLIDDLKKNTGTIRIDGHTDDVRIAKAETKAQFPKGNWQLGSERALNVLLYLKDKGVREERMSYLSWGEFSPRADNKTAEGRRQNRRVEIMVLFN